MERKKWIAFWICAILLLSVKEDMPLLLLFYTPLIFVRGSKKHSIILVVVCIAYWFFVSKGIEMIFGQAVGSDVNHRYGYLGRTPNEIVTTVITEPTKWLSTLRAPKQFAYLYYLFIQGLFMAVLSPLALLGAIPNIAQNTLSSLDFQKSLSGAYYSGIVITSIYIACLYSLRNRSSLFIKALLTAFIIQIFVITLVMSPLPYGIRNEWIEVMPTHRISSFKNMLSLIPDNAPVGTQNNLGAHLSERDFIVKYSHLFDQADYILLHTQIPLYKFNGPYFKAHRQLLSHSLDEFDTYSKNMFFKKDFGVLSYDPPFYLFKRDHPRTLNHTAYKSSLHHLKNLRYCADDTNAALNPCPDDPILPTSNPLKQ